MSTNSSHVRAANRDTANRDTANRDTAVLSPDELARALAVRDLTDPAQGHHAVQLIVDAILQRLRTATGSDLRTVREHPLVEVAENYDRLGYGPGAVTRDARYTRYASATHLLRSHTTAMIPPALRRLAAEPSGRGPRWWRDVLLACPGITYRRDVIDRLHTGTPHQLDLWRIVADRPMTEADLDAMIDTVVGAVLPGAVHRTIPARHPYTTAGRQIDVLAGGAWVEIGECGLAARAVLAGAGLGASVSGLAMGLGLDRLLMLRKGVPDIRLIAAADLRIAGQMLDLAPYRPVSAHPPIARDLSLAVADQADPELLGDRVREALGPDADAIEEIRLLAETPVGDLPAAAVARLGARPGQKNLLLRVVLRHPSRTLTDRDANELRDRVYAALHEGDAHQWASGAAHRPADRC
ncbi:MAG TPA: hypothetical protein VGJ44_19685 [Kribbellaceae bacterium]